VWNVATDFTINADLVAAGLQLPPDALQSAEFAGQGAESVFAELMRRRLKDSPDASNQADQGCAGEQAAAGGVGGDQDGSPGDAEADQDGNPGAGGPGVLAKDPGRCGGILDAPPEGGDLADQAADMEARIRQAVSVARAANAGTLPGFLAGVVDELNAPRVSWRDELAAFVDDATTRATTWTRPNKRFLSMGLFLPGTTADSVGRLAVVVDTSGSIYGEPKVLSAFRDEIQGMLDGGRVEAVHVIHCDAAVAGTQDFAAGDVVDLRPLGGGGTRFSPAFRYIADNVQDAAAIVYLTDLECSDFGPEPEQPVMWAAWGRARPRVPFGRVIPLDPHA
jgi:predicted metal-dependent peptidase